MQMTQLFQRIGRNDVKLFWRDSFLIAMAAYMFVIGLVLRFLLPWANTYLANNGILPNESITISLADVYPMLVAYFTIYLGAVLVGVVFGFLLLDEKDDNTLKAMLVTPVSLNQYLTYRVGIPLVIGFFGVLIVMILIGEAMVAWWQLPFIALGASLTAPIAALFFATFAENKVQGFAMTKFVGTAGLVFVIGWFVSPPLQWLFGIFPPFWVAKAYWMALAGESFWWAALIMGIVTQAGLIMLIARRFNTVAYAE